MLDRRADIWTWDKWVGCPIIVVQTVIIVNLHGFLQVGWRDRKIKRNNRLDLPEQDWQGIDGAECCIDIIRDIVSELSNLRIW
jgi:hypothetical protein